MANKTQDFDFSKAAEDFFAAFKMDTKVFDDASRDAAEFCVRMGRIALGATRKNVELSNAWATETLKKAEGINKVQKDVAAYGTTASEFVSDQAQSMPEKLAQYAEVAKTAQIEAVELLMSVSKDVQSKFAAAAEDMTKKTA
ncbi:MAG: hypothetical protein GDA53_04500 [Rhodobacteraceae bacterium]|nr:hypothetical protein [Paracoccaceae bacterium]